MNDFAMASAAEPPEKNVFGSVVQEDAALEKLGYQPELKRSFGLLGMVGFSFSIVTSWTALSGVLIIGVTSGGPPVMIYSWIGICLFTLAVAYSMAEMCSAYPVAGGQYSWCYILAPRSFARGLSYVCGWFMLIGIGILAMGATSNFICANFILGMANLFNPDYTIQRWHTVLVTYLVCVVLVIINVWGPHLLDKISRGILLWNIGSLVVTVVTILAMNNHKQSASFVFSEFQNFTGFGTAYAAIIGLLQSGFGMCCYDAPSHMTEEMLNARREAPKAIIWSVYIGGVTGLIFLIAMCFCIGDIDTTAGSSTGVPLIQIFYDSVGSVGGACALTTIITVIALFASNALLAEGSRAVFAFARDRGLPFSKTLAKVSSKRQIPIYAIMLAAAVQIILDSIYYGNITGFNTVISIATVGFYLSYALALFAGILWRFYGPTSTLDGPYSLGRYGLVCNVVGLLFLLFTSISFNFPSVAPVDSNNMNYTCAAIGAVGLIAAITWITTGRKQFTGPLTGAVVERLGREGMNELSVESMKGGTLEKGT